MQRFIPFTSTRSTVSSGHSSTLLLLIYSFILVSATASRLRPSCQENISKKGILKRQMYKLLHFTLCPSELSHRFFHHFYSKYLVSVLLI